MVVEPKSINGVSRSHYTYSGPGTFNHSHRHEKLVDQWKDRDFDQRGFTVGIGGPVGSGKTALVLALCRAMQQIPTVPLGVVTNDIFTQEDAEFLVRNRALPPERIRAVETGGCPHAAIREDVSANLLALEQLTTSIKKEMEGVEEPTMKKNVLLLCESGGDNLAANFSSELADLTLYVIDVAGGDKVPRKGGPGITQSDLLVINKIDLAAAVGSDLTVMKSDADKMRGGNSGYEPGPTILAAVKHGTGLQDILNFILHQYEHAMEL